MNCFHRIVLGVLLSLPCSPAGATPHQSLEEFRKLRLPGVVLESVTQERADTKKNLPAHVAVKGLIGEHIRFELLLPEDWNQRFAMGGGGGFVGTVQNAAIFSLGQGFATAGTDTGHKADSGVSARWALDDLESRVNFGYLAVHRTAEVSKSLIRAYFGKDPDHSYFVGCSRGGGQAMMEAQRYPADFDGIVAGAPAFDWTGIAATMTSIAKALYPDPNSLDQPVLNREALQKLAKGILEQCDGQDGLKDGVIQDPPTTQFELEKVAGLTPEQRNAVQKIFEGARNEKGPIYPGFSPVAECVPDQWIAWITGPAPQALARERVPDLSFAFGTQIFKYLVFNNPDWDYSKYDFSTFKEDTRLAASYLNATDPKLAGFKARNGKLILWHGWADPALPAQGTVDYYRAVQAHDPHAAEYCRLFMVPGCLHCGGGPGASEIDWLSVMVDWVERGKAPDRLVAVKKESGKIVMSRPLLPYPQYGRFKGAGDSSKAESFESRSTAAH